MYISYTLTTIFIFCVITTFGLVYMDILACFCRDTSEIYLSSNHNQRCCGSFSVSVDKKGGYSTFS